MLLAAAPLSCADGGAAGGRGLSACVPGSQIACACEGGDHGVQACAPDGASYLPCECGGDSSPKGKDDAPDQGSSSSGGAPGTTDAPPRCGNGVEDPGECPEVCPQDCPQDTDDTGEPICDRFAGLIEGATSVWTEGASTGLDAGDLQCAAIGGDHVCSYAELVDAEAAGELSVLAAGTTAWVHRVTPTTIDDVFYPADLGGRCVDWTYGANELADGEYVEATADGIVFHLDSDTFYDGIDPSHAQLGLLECGGVTRAIPCCNPEC